MPLIVKAAVHRLCSRASRTLAQTTARIASTWRLPREAGSYRSLRIEFVFEPQSVRDLQKESAYASSGAKLDKNRPLQPIQTGPLPVHHIGKPVYRNSFSVTAPFLVTFRACPHSECVLMFLRWAAKGCRRIVTTGGFPPQPPARSITHEEPTQCNVVDGCSLRPDWRNHGCTCCSDQLLQKRQSRLPRPVCSYANADKPAKHSCKGKNDCKGTGGCKSSDNGCKGKNSCKGKGGCATDGSKMPKAV